MTFMSLEVGAGGAQSHKQRIRLSASSWFWKWAARGAAGLRIVRNLLGYSFGSAQQGGGWLQHYKECIE